LRHFFLMPHGREFNDAARLFGIAYQRADSIKQLNRILPNIMAQPGAAILECVIPQGTGTTQLKALLAELKLAV
jgi:2-succinyl-6-hydroxy-2,4-cyclohexadiene-1-carboxylate synthase